MRVLVTGANGFVAGALIPLLEERGHQVVAGVRDRDASGAIANSVAVGDIGPLTNWAPALDGVDAVIHLAGRAHVMRESAVDPAQVYDRVNTQGSRRLAECALEAGVKRLVFVSSIKVNGERTRERAFAADDAPVPCDPYGVSKWNAEQALRRIEAGSALEVTVVRPPLVYGPGVKGNFRRLMGLVRRGVPLPFGAIRNRRSLVSVFNLSDLLECCARHPAAAAGTFLVSDGEDLSTPELIRRLACAMGRPARLLPVPAPVLRACLSALGRRAEFERLCGSLQVDPAPGSRALGWKPPFGVDEGLRRTVTVGSGVS